MSDSGWQAGFVELLLRWNERINLVSKGDLHRVAERHIQDSLQLVPLIPSSVDRGIDVGSGAGFPGLILAKATGLAFDLIESDQRKVAFLREAARAIAAPVTVHSVRIEVAQVLPAPLVTARALAPLPRLLSLAAPLLSPNGLCLFHKGAGYERELTDSNTQWHMHVERFPSRTARGAAILRITELHRVPT